MQRGRGQGSTSVLDGREVRQQLQHRPRRGRQIRHHIPVSALVVGIHQDGLRHQQRVPRSDERVVLDQSQRAGQQHRARAAAELLGAPGLDVEGAQQCNRRQPRDGGKQRGHAQAFPERLSCQRDVGPRPKAHGLPTKLATSPEGLVRLLRLCGVCLDPLELCPSCHELEQRPTCSHQVFPRPPDDDLVRKLRAGQHHVRDLDGGHCGHARERHRQGVAGGGELHRPQEDFQGRALHQQRRALLNPRSQRLQQLARRGVRIPRHVHDGEAIVDVHVEAGVGVRCSDPTVHQGAAPEQPASRGQRPPCPPATAPAKIPGA
mmetsp:Transcript_25499/g.85342  ORF Transcript_25499/g.85342 Transcript_25499/m.85342 type:complete len:319 (-) Transcript_25499:108-1064(-)